MCLFEENLESTKLYKEPEKNVTHNPATWDHHC